ncbi:unnamed protein product [Dibothriocephalus latus]|uniref:Uncharacterized protein n=1 Tax=Dibothriocephalus latus TaxID=60516 RepID=A0A3P6QH07_DIBLA|nr:unnamed protein product [Dibothriocephalus latus]
MGLLGHIRIHNCSVNRDVDTTSTYHTPNTSSSLPLSSPRHPQDLDPPSSTPGNTRSEQNSGGGGGEGGCGDGCIKVSNMKNFAEDVDVSVLEVCCRGGDRFGAVNCGC